MNIIFITGRVILGGFFINSGYKHFAKLNMLSEYTKTKGVPFAPVAVSFSGVMLVLGGFSILLGIYPMIGIVMLAVFLVPVAIIMHNFWAVDDPVKRAGERIHFMKDMGLLGAVLMLVAIPTPWAYSLIQ